MGANTDNVKDASKLLELSGKINSAAGRFEEELKNLDRLIASFSEAWEGDVKDAFDQKYQEKYQKDINEIIEALRKYYSTADSIAREKIEQISSGQKRIRGL